VVFVFASVLMLGRGIERTLGRAGAADVAVVLRKGSDAELSSGIELPAGGPHPRRSPEVAKVRPDGQPDAVGELVVVILLDKLGTDGVSNVQVRGVPDNVMTAFARRCTWSPAGRRAGHRRGGRGARPSPGASRASTWGSPSRCKKNRPVRVVGVFEDGARPSSRRCGPTSDTVRAAFGREGSCRRCACA
jgi:putative ABC transport system permease protein